MVSLARHMGLRIQMARVRVCRPRQRAVTVVTLGYSSECLIDTRRRPEWAWR